jgi:hypothetical protein
MILFLSLLIAGDPPVVYRVEQRNTDNQVVLNVRPNSPRPLKATAFTPNEVLGWVAGDLLTLRAQVRPYVRYISVPPSAPLNGNWNHAVSLILNEAVSQSPSIIPPRVLANGWLLRIYLPDLFPSRDLVGSSGELGSERLLRLWDEITFNDFRFFDRRADPIFLPAVPYLHTDNVRYQFIRTFPYGSWIDQSILGKLKAIGAHHAPVVSADVFANLAYTSVNTPVGKGRYYQLVGVHPHLKNQRDNLLSLFGASFERSLQLDAQRRAGIIQSRVTGLDRIVVRMQSLIDDVWITLDQNRDNERRTVEQFNQLFIDSHAAEEGFVIKPNGLRIMFASNQDGTFQDSVPPGVATDKRVASFDQRIAPGFRCWTCHGRFDGNDSGYIAFNNDLFDALSADPPIVDEQSNRIIPNLRHPSLPPVVVFNNFNSPPENVARLRGQYGRAFQLTSDLLTARDKYNLAVFQATDLYRNGGGLSIAQTREALLSINLQVTDGLFGPRELMLELGHVPKSQPNDTVGLIKELNELFPYREGPQLEDMMLRMLRIENRPKKIKYEDFAKLYSRTLLAYQQLQSQQSNANGQ